MDLILCGLTGLLVGESGSFSVLEGSHREVLPQKGISYCSFEYLVSILKKPF